MHWKIKYSQAHTKDFFWKNVLVIEFLTAKACKTKHESPNVLQRSLQLWSFVGVLCLFLSIYYNSEASLCESKGYTSNHVSIWKESSIERNDQTQKGNFRTVFVQTQDCLKCSGWYEDKYFTRTIIFPLLLFFSLWSFPEMP